MSDATHPTPVPGVAVTRYQYLRNGGNTVDNRAETVFTRDMTNTATAARTETAAWNTAKANEVETLAAAKAGEVRRSLLRSAAQYRNTAANIERRGY